MLWVIGIFITLLLIRIYLIKNRHVWYIVYYILISFFGAYVWSQITWNIYTCIEDPSDFAIIDYYYIIQLAAYCSFILFILAFDSNENDSGNDMIIHHATAFTLLTISFLFKYRRVGFTVIFMHDVSDVFLSVSRYLKQQYGDKNKWTIAVFATFVVAFIVTRLGLLPFYVFTKCLPIVHNVPTTVCIVGLTILCGLHVYWGTKIFAIIKKIINKQRQL